jgi:hypothetical protein
MNWLVAIFVAVIVGTVLVILDYRFMPRVGKYEIRRVRNIRSWLMIQAVSAVTAPVAIAAIVYTNVLLGLDVTASGFTLILALVLGVYLWLVTRCLRHCVSTRDRKLAMELLLQEQITKHR